jgi:glycerol kinase
LHLNASYQIYSKNTFTIEFVDQYLNLCKNKQILTDTSNEYGDNYSGYHEHRHDQSVLSLLAIKHKIKPLVDPSEWGNKCGCRGFDQLFLHHRNPNYII